MKHQILLLIAIVSITSCVSEKSGMPNYVFNSLPVEHIQILENQPFKMIDREILIEERLLKIAKKEKNGLSKRIINNLKRLEEYKTTGNKLVFETVKSDCGEIVFELKNDTSYYSNPDSNFYENWFRLNYELLKLTANVRYADELEKLIENRGKKSLLSEELIKAGICTRNNDQLFINYFMNSVISYQHTTCGVVEITQRTNYPVNDKIELEFGNEDKRFVELFIRIPTWTKNAKITVGGVKYKAVPGEYCRVAKKWKSGNIAGIALKF